ncbi:MAG: tetratricopeptide repeat protein [Casimicrobiaceae bacterium]
MNDELERRDLAAAAEHVAAENPEAYIPGDRRRALASGRPIPDRADGAALFADISGFTPLTEALAKELGPQRGAEELTKNLNRVFAALVDELDRFGGEVIYFAGDAITCWLDGDDGARATACALAMQDTMARVGKVLTPAGARVELAMKVAIAVGRARRFVVGDPDVQLIDVLAGRLIDALAAAEHHASRGEVVLDASAHVALADRIDVKAVREDPASGESWVVVGGLRAAVVPMPAPPAHAPLPETVVRPWLLPAVYERLSARRGEFMAELRPAYPVFVRFGGIDYDRDDEAIAKLDSFARQVQRIVTSFGGNLLHLSLGDKGAYLFAVFGSPIAHEDDAARACAAALQLRELGEATAARDLQIGITYGRLRSGMYGHPQRQAFTCLGDAVNVAARLMASAPPSGIYVSERVRVAAGGAFLWDDLPPLAVKGKAEPITIFGLTGSKRHASRARGSHALPLVGRFHELETLASRHDLALACHGQVIGIAAEAGMGKSRLVAEFARTAAERGTLVVTGECQSYGTNTSYFVWRAVWAALFRLDTSQPEHEQLRALEAQLGAIDSSLLPRAPLLANLLDLQIQDNALTAGFDAKLRKESLESLLVDCLRARAGETPLLIVLEDCHWIDPLSRDLLDVLGRSIGDARVMIAVAYRPAPKIGVGLGVGSLPYFSEIDLAELDREQSAELVTAKLAHMLGAGTEPPAMLVDLVTARAQGNPFYIEELLSFINSQGVDLRDEAALRSLDLPESLHSLILGRIDTVGEAPRQTLKVASVIGRVFLAPALPGVYPELGKLRQVQVQLAELAEADLVNVDVAATQQYVFKHTVTQQVAYESLPFALRATLHERVGGYIEHTEPDAIDRNLDLLAHHYWRTDNLLKKREYLHRAGLAAQAAYANAAAIDYFQRLAPLLDDAARIDVLLKLGNVLELIGDWPRAEQIDKEALVLADQLGDEDAQAQCQMALAETGRKQSRFDEAVARLELAARVFTEVSDPAGLGKVAHMRGTIAAQRGEYDQAMEHYGVSLRIRESLGDKASMGSILSNLGVIAEYRGEYQRARSFHERAMALRTEIGDRRAIAVSMTNLGMIAHLEKHFQEAQQWFDRSMLLNREVGDAWMVAVCHNNLGNATRSLGDHNAARKHYADSLRAYRNYDDRWSMAFLLEDIGLLAARDGDAPSALELVGAADAVREAGGMPRAPSLEAEIGNELDMAAAAMSDRECAMLRAYGRSLEFGAAVEHALAVCETTTSRGDEPRRMVIRSVAALGRANWMAVYARG